MILGLVLTMIGIGAEAHAQGPAGGDRVELLAREVADRVTPSLDGVEGDAVVAWNVRLDGRASHVELCFT
jgi:hypothetical protein